MGTAAADVKPLRSGGCKCGGSMEPCTEAAAEAVNRGSNWEQHSEPACIK